MKKAYFAGGCFWGVEHLYSLVEGVEDVISGYAQSNVENPSYNDIVKGRIDAVEAVEITYDESVISYEKLLDIYIKAVDLTTLNKQGVDVGRQYRSGIYCLSEDERLFVENYFKDVQKSMSKEIVTEVEMLINFYKAEEYHQNYIKKHPNVGCHIDFSILEEQ